MVNTNPWSVLSGVGQVTYPSAVTAVGVRIADSAGADAGQTPIYPVTSANPMTVPVLLLRSSSSYSMTAVGMLADGGAMFSAPFPFTTGKLPVLVPHYSVADGGHPAGPYTLISQAPAGVVETIDNLDNPNITNYEAAVDEHGEPVWYITLPQGQGPVGDFQKQPDGTYTTDIFLPNAPVRRANSQLASAYYQYDNLGNLLHIWQSPDSIITNEHDMRILPDGTALIMGIISELQDLSQIPGGPAQVSCNDTSQCPTGFICSDGTCDTTVYMDHLENIAPDGGVLWTWNEFDHFQASNTTGVPFNTPTFDATHSNAIDIMTDGNYLVGMRDMSQMVKVNKADGGVMWILGGQSSSFVFVNDPLNGPSFQHGARELPNGDIIMFDNGLSHIFTDGGGGPRYWQGRGVEYALDMDAGTATMVWEYDPKPPLQAVVFGLSERLDGGNTLITFGDTGVVTEVDPDGGVVWSMVDDQKVIYPDGGLVYWPDGGVNNTLRDWGIYRSFRLDTVY